MVLANPRHVLSCTSALHCLLFGVLQKGVDTHQLLPLHAQQSHNLFYIVLNCWFFKTSHDTVDAHLLLLLHILKLFHLDCLIW